MLYQIHLARVGFELITLVVIGTDCTDSCKSNYHTITTAPNVLYNIIYRQYRYTGDINFISGGDTYTYSLNLPDKWQSKKSQYDLPDKWQSKKSQYELPDKWQSKMSQYDLPDK